jgi:hypothetical protein
LTFDIPLKGESGTGLWSSSMDVADEDPLDAPLAKLSSLIIVDSASRQPRRRQCHFSGVFESNLRGLFNASQHPNFRCSLTIARVEHYVLLRPPALKNLKNKMKFYLLKGIESFIKFLQALNDR